MHSTPRIHLSQNRIAYIKHSVFKTLRTYKFMLNILEMYNTVCKFALA